MANGERDTAKAKRVPLGPALIWSSATLDAMSRITERDVEQAKRMWRRLAPPKYRNLLDARESDGDRDKSQAEGDE